ncbi:beta-glucosidase [Mucilaginibacter sp. PPCGB 2223]|uniref:GH1 family beta-glucosidase n=1 Tax=Mucilaginibacter sp. PPCGB 2223 TaxID=1886027 RepID=UPI0008266E43|nr:GH1 family beta-glucosidase [Mucilaginibacter sp. PPCGB 2223]OCX53435.1 beta-glucosidase [Mucilaginibacter sp. PPCGB 2223]
MDSHIENNNLSKQLFGNDFTWGVSSAAAQTEGSFDVDGRGLSVWDVFSQTKGKTLNGDHPQIATDFYNRYREDILLIKQLNIPNFRFSVAWPRIMPDGTQASLNQAGIDFYNRVIDFCLENGIEPWVTLYHWDIPHVLEQKGGWTNREVVGWFSDFVTVCAQNFGDRVKHWMVMNEPSVFVGAGYFLGLHAPGRTGVKNFLPAVHHAILCMAAGGRILRQLCPGAEIGTTFSCSYIEPYSKKPRHIAAAKRVDAILNRLFFEPTIGLGYPTEVKIFSEIKKYMLPGDEQLMTFDFDFIGLQNYTREIVKASFFVPYVGARLVKPEKRNVPVTAMKWEVYPQAIYHIIKQFEAYPQVKKIIITENGAAFLDMVTGGIVDDPLRLGYLKDHIAQVLKAKQEGCKVGGYFIWTLTDNFEWAEGYHPRFGIIHVDFETQKRTVKSSGKWYGEFLKG